MLFDKLGIGRVIYIQLESSSTSCTFNVQVVVERRVCDGMSSDTCRRVHITTKVVRADLFLGDHINDEYVCLASRSGIAVPREVRVFVPEKFSVICLINLGLNRLSGVLVDVVKLNYVEEAVGIRVGPELLIEKSVA